MSWKAWTRSFQNVPPYGSARSNPPPLRLRISCIRLFVSVSRDSLPPRLSKLTNKACRDSLLVRLPYSAWLRRPTLLDSKEAVDTIRTVFITTREAARRGGCRRAYGGHLGLSIEAKSLPILNLCSCRESWPDSWQLPRIGARFLAAAENHGPIFGSCRESWPDFWKRAENHGPISGSCRES
jgi:hypothetical protein